MATSSFPAHKPRRKNAKRAGTPASDVSSISSTSSPVQVAARKPSHAQKPSHPLAALMWPARSSVSQWEILPLVLMVVGLSRWAAGLWGYSGYQKPPLHGDYEAQRHWMELTAHLPISQWYFHDLPYWGLDYPPLTAYHSYLLGRIGSYINPSWFSLHISRGNEDPLLKVFMRITVIVSEYLIYVPAAVIFVRRFSRHLGVQTWDSAVALTAILMQPATILVDHVHFQYNTVMLGFVLASMSSVLAGRLSWACVFFVAALGFKQMALYYAPAVFAYLLGVCLFPRLNVGRLLSISVVTAASFAVLVLPLFVGAMWDRRRGINARPETDGFVAASPILGHLSYKLDAEAWYYPVIQQSAQLVYRIFPFARGLFEDKVANFWCAANVFVKLKNYPLEYLQRASLLATLGAITPPCLLIFLHPRKELLPLALAATAWGFFLFSFQVHEKSVLLPLMPMTVLLAGKDGMSRYSRAWIGFANILGVWTLFPLLQRVDLRVPYYVLSLLWAYLLGLPPTSVDVYRGMTNDWLGLATIAVHGSFYGAMVMWHVLEAFLLPPRNLPDLWVVVNVGVGAVGFALCYLWCVGTLIMGTGMFARSVQKRAVSEKGKAKSL